MTRSHPARGPVRWRSALAVLAVAGGLLLGGAGPAAAHVTADSADPVGDGSVVLTFGFNHACAAAGTTALTMHMPAGSVALSATAPPGWTSGIVGTTIDWSGPEIPSGRAASFTVTARLAGQAGQTLMFPTVQRCADGDGFDWADPDESADEPAPRLVATAAVLDPALAASADNTTGEGASAAQITIAIALFALLCGAAAWWARHGGAARPSRADR